MKLSSLDIHGVRNLSRVSLTGLGPVNIVYGANGAGKSSVLEAIHMLALARSFRSTQLNPVIEYGRDSCVVFGQLKQSGRPDVNIGIKRQRKGRFAIKIDGVLEKSVLALAERLPVQLIHSTSYLLLESGPKQRRQFLDWGVFHVKHSFIHAWKRAQRSIKQRNAVLRAGGDKAQLRQWDRELIAATRVIDQARHDYFEAFQPVFSDMLVRLSDLQGVTARYHKGWAADKSIEQALTDNYLRDRERGLTHSGPHRADLQIRVNQIDAAQVLSRGQLKLVVCAMRLAQTALMQQGEGQSCLLLIDDLPAELDLHHQARLCELIDELDAQLFITCIDPNDLAHLRWRNKGPPTMFHVKQGEIVRS